MTIQDLLKPIGITTPTELSKRTGLSRQRAWQIWNERGGIGKRMARKISAATGLPLYLLLVYQENDHPRQDAGGKRKRSSG